MSAVVQITRHSMQQIGIANRKAETCSEDSYKRHAEEVMVASLQRNNQVAEQIADEMLCKFAPAEMAAIIRAAAAKNNELACQLILARMDVAIKVLAELEGIKAAEDARYA